jgi:hypothetical protein
MPDGGTNRMKNFQILIGVLIGMSIGIFHVMVENWFPVILIVGLGYYFLL